MLRRLCLSCSYFLLAFVLTSADMHLQTSADPIAQLIHLKLGDDTIDLYLNAPGVSFEKALDGSLAFVSFEHLGASYRVRFHKNGGSYGGERPALIQRFRIYDGLSLLDGVSESFDQSGNLITQSTWRKGKLHGVQKIFDNDKQLREERQFEEGVPVGLWSTYYVDGSLASQTHFPEDLKAWQASYIPESEKGPLDVSGLHSQAYYHPLTVKEIWFDEKGHKEGEFERLAHLDHEGFQLLPIHESKNFDDYGRLVHHTQKKRFQECETVTINNSGILSVKSEVRFGGRVYKKSSLSLPSK